MDDRELTNRRGVLGALGAWSSAAAAAMLSDPFTDVAAQSTPAEPRMLPTRPEIIVDPARFGMTGRYEQNATRLMQDMFDQLPDGSIVDFDAGVAEGSGGHYRVDDTIVIRKNISLRGRASRITGVMPDDATDLIRFEPASDTRGILVEGLRLAFERGGRHGVSFDGQAVGMIGNVVSRCLINGGAGGYAIRMAGAGNHYNAVRDCTLTGTSVETGAVLLEGADGTKLVDNLIAGIGCGVRIHTIAGAFKTGIIGGAIRSRDVGVYITGGQQIDLERVQFEQGTFNAGTDLNQARYKSHVVIEAARAFPAGEEVRDVRIVACNFGGGINQDSAITLTGYVRDVLIDENYFASIGRENTDIFIAAPTVAWTRIGPNNRVGGPRADLRRGEANAFDPKDLLFVRDGGRGTYGVYKQARELGLASGWSAGPDFAFWKEVDDVLRFRSTLVAGRAVPGTLLATLPEGFRPRTEQRISVPTNGDSIALLAVATSGAMTVRRVPEGAVLYMDQVAVPVKGRTSYLSGPY